ncbi:hypothetical protein GVN24_13835 [Rhizobium sp. CRIBSB]|nr:hypothetical protein [Rhizobium sp. CRIBSB]
MQIIGTDIIAHHGSNGGFTVEFRGDGEERVSVRMAATENGDLSRDNALDKAQVILLQAARFGVSEIGDTEIAENLPREPSAAVESLRLEKQDKRTMQRGGTALQEGLEDTYPASDPVSATYTSTASGDKT